jgi:hypothetical protein
VNPSKDKGTKFESSIVDLLHATHWPHAERRALRGVHDGGDIAGIPGVVIECKAAARIDLSGWLKEVRAEVVNATADIGVVVHKRRGTTNPAEQYVLMDGATFVQLLHEAGR